MSKISYYRQIIETRLRELVKPFYPEVLYDAMTYYLFQEGKRIRPILVCSVCDALGGELEDASTFGCAIEMVHNYSLIHDDLPCLDNDVLRRGKPTCHMVFGEDIALLAGDALLTLAFEVLSNRQNFNHISVDEILMAINVLSKKAGFSGMVGGQVMDIKGLVSREEINLKKTAELFSASFMLGAISAHRIDLMERLESLGRDFGLLFQMVDDYKDKDGLYKLIGERLKLEIERKKEEFVESLLDMGFTLEPFEEILNLLIP